MSVHTPNIPQIVERNVRIRKVNNFDELLSRHREAAEAAIGFLSSWGDAKAFPTVSINCCGDRGVMRGAEITAVYKTPENAVGFVIGAIWHPDEGSFSFHS